MQKNVFLHFEHLLWMELAHFLEMKENLPSTDRLHGKILNKIYEDIMNKCFDEVNIQGDGTIFICRGTDNSDKSKWSFIIPNSDHHLIN